MTQPLHHYLGSNTLAGLHEHAQRLNRLQAALTRILPGKLGAACKVANYKQGTLILTARSGAAASRIKQMIPSMLEQLQTDGQPVEHIRIRVGMPEEPRQQPRTNPRTVGPQARNSLLELMDSLPEDEPLRQSLERLLARSRSE